jgi:hypothetical protein
MTDPPGAKVAAAEDAEAPREALARLVVEAEARCELAPEDA